jgi:hypothetical protein
MGKSLIRRAAVLGLVGVLIIWVICVSWVIRLLISEVFELKVRNCQAPIYGETIRWKLLLLEEVFKSGKSYRDFVILREIAYAESGFNHYDKNGEVLRGLYNKHDLGIFQINELYHKEKAQEMNLNPRSPEDNIKYAVWLYKHKGTTPWKWSKHKWSKKLARLRF